MTSSKQAVHRTIVMVDVERFGDRHRTLPHQLGTRAALYRVVADALSAVGVAWNSCYHEDRGDSVFVLIPPEYAKSPLVEVMPGALVRALHSHNETSPAAQRVRLRVAVHAGEVAFDKHGVTSTALTAAFRLLDAPPVRTALAESPGLIALVVSRWIFDEVVRHSAVLDPATFRPVPVEVKEIRDTAWIALPDHPYPADPIVLDQPTLAPDGSGAATPRQLPAPPTLFVGREEHLADLDRALTATAGDPATGTAVLISALGGAGGIGKTWLALHWAHRNADRFPDGQLFVDLRGFSPDSQSLQPAAAVRRFLDALDVDSDSLPTELDAQAALYRSLVSGKRMLIVVDNAATTDQVAPLLPGTPTCTVLVTGRRKLASLIDRYGARHLQLDLLAGKEARDLLTRRLGHERVAAEPDATNELIELCGHHPLALAITARHAATRPHIPLAEFATELRDLGLDMLDDDDLTASLPTVLSWSLRHLTPKQQEVFALLSLAPGPDIGLPAAASLTSLSETQTRKVLRALEDASLIERHPGNRYAMHDLVRAYATTLAYDVDEPVRQTALKRVADFYLHTAYTADRLLNPHAQPIRLNTLTPGVHLYPLFDELAALAWLEAEHSHLIATQHTAVAHHWHQVVWQLAWTLHTFHARRGHRHNALAVWRAAVEAAEHLPDPNTRALAHRRLGAAYARLGRHAEGIEHLRQALALAERSTELAHTHHDLAVAWEQLGDDRQALEHARHALGLYRVLGDSVREAITLNVVGWYAARLGDYDTAREHCQAALTLHRRHHHLTGEADALDSLGWINHLSGDQHKAIHHCQQALILLRALGDTYAAADTLDHLGHPHAALGEVDQARVVWREAVELYRKQGRDADARRVQQQVDDLDHTTPTGQMKPAGASSATGQVENE